MQNQPSTARGATGASEYDVVVVGGGPAGASSAGFCALAGLRVLVIERAFFPRDKVCGDCLNPAAWPVLERLGVGDGVRQLPHARLREVEFVGLRGRKIRLTLPDDPLRGEIAVRRRELDALLLKSAGIHGAEVWHGWACTALRTLDSAAGRPGCEVEITDATKEGRGRKTISARFVVGADGRNSVVARLAGMFPKVAETAGDDRGRIGLQTHVPCPPGFGDKVEMRWFADGYGGMCPTGGGDLNISLAAPARAIERLKRWAQAEFSLAKDHPWQTIAPVDRVPVGRPATSTGCVYLVGDAARTVEPFTGEGIYYALRSGELAAESIVAAARHANAAPASAEYCQAHAAMYRGRLWVNRLARAAGRHPRVASWALEALRWRPELLGYLTAKVVR